MASRIVPGGRDSRGTCVRVRAAAAPALPVRSHRPHLAAPPPPARPTPPKAGGHAPPRALASTSKQACTSAAPAAPVRVLPHDFVVSWSATHKHFLRWTSDGTWDRALAELQHPGPPCPRPQPGALGRGDRLLLDQSVTRSWSSRLRRRQEDRRHQTPHRRGHPGPAGGRAGHRGQRAGSGGGAPAARAEPATAAPGSATCGPSRATPAAWCRL
jgi:hypothetical protein